jgi:hypothetical protein
MGIRLYPCTTDAAALETLCGVPAGTAERLHQLKLRHHEALTAAQASGSAGLDLDDLRYQQWKEIHADDATARLDTFLVFGWGKFHPAGVAPGCSGCLPLSEADRIADLLRINGIGPNEPAALLEFLRLTEGVCWS